MKKSLISLLVLIATTSFGQPHILPCTEDHSRSRCTGWATGRSFGKYNGDAVCNPATLYQPTMDANYFEWVSETNAAVLATKTLIGWGNNGADHVAFRESGSRFSHVPSEYGLPDTNITLSEINALQGGGPSGYFNAIGNRTRDVTAENRFADNSNGGSVNWGDLGTVSSPSPRSLDHSFQKTLTRVVGQMSDQNIRQSFWKWENDYGWNTTSPSFSFWVERNETRRAVHNNLYDVAFQYSKPTGTFTGTIVVNGQSQSTPSGTFEVEQYQNISAQASTYYVFENVSFLFSSWSPGGSTNPSSSFTPSGSSQLYTVTANFSPKPLPPANLYVGGNVGDPVHMTWTSHSTSSGVTEYQIWRKVKPKNQGEQTPELLTTVPRTTSSYTDYGYMITPGYTEDLVSYDVRARYNAGGVSAYANPNYNPVFAEVSYRAKSNKTVERLAGPTAYSLSAQPNPFNPSTVITYDVAEPASVRIEIYDAIGRRLTELVNAEKSSGRFSTIWNGRNDAGRMVASGVYYCRMSAIPMTGGKDVVQTARLLLLK